MRCKANSMAESVTDANRVAPESMGYPELCRLQETAVRASMTEKKYLCPSKWVVARLCAIYSLLPSVFDILGGTSYSSWWRCNLETQNCEWETPCYVMKCELVAHDYYITSHTNENSISQWKPVTSDQMFSSLQRAVSPDTGIARTCNKVISKGHKLNFYQRIV